MSSSSVVALAALALAGCNALLGLDAAAVDNDRDGIGDADDNCPFDANHEQRDSDSDGLGDVCDCALSGIDDDDDGTDDACDDCIGPGATGMDSGGNGIDDGCEPCPMAVGVDADADGVDDACDTCLEGSPHDEDADGIADACDNCPGRANPDQGETDGDALGDACDNAGVDAGDMRFDGFAERDVTLWVGTVPGWMWTEDALLSTQTSARYANVHVGAPYVVQAVVAEPKPTQAVQLGVVAPSATLSCTVGGDRMLTLVDDAFISRVCQAGPVEGPGPIELRLLLVGGQAYCQGNAPGSDNTVGCMLSVSSLDGRVRIATDNGGRFEYLWAVANAL